MSHFFKPLVDTLNPLQEVIGGLPDHYTVFDTETTGFRFSSDLIVEVGWCVVRDRKVESYGGCVIDWTTSPIVTPAWLQDKLARTKEAVEFKKGKPTGKNYRFTYDVLSEEGAEPREALETFRSMLAERVERNELLIGHNAWHFDANMVNGNFQRFTDTGKIDWKVNSIFDTGLVEKASQLGPGMRPWPDDNLTTYFKRISNRRAAVKWALDTHCVPKYGLVEKHDLQMDEAHTAGFDCYVNHLLLEHWREAMEAAAE